MLERIGKKLGESEGKLEGLKERKVKWKNWKRVIGKIKRKLSRKGIEQDELGLNWNELKESWERLRVNEMIE